MTTELAVEISLRSAALLASAPPASNQTETLPFVPGNTLRGVLARRYLELAGDPGSEEFRRLFVSGEVRFGFAFLQGSEVLPLSARSCKYVPGFRRHGGHGVEDLLLSSPEACPDPACERPLDYFQGFWRPGEGCEAPVKTRLVTRTAIDPERGTARQGQLYTQKVLAEGQAFSSLIEAPGDLAGRLAELLETGFSAVLGTGGSRGQGWAEVRLQSSRRLGPGQARERFERFRAAAGKPVLAMTLLSDGLFQDDYLRDSTAPSPGDLAALNLRPEDWQPRPARAFMDLRQVFGFDGFPIGLPRPPRMAVAAGSAFLFEAVDGREPMIPAGDGLGWIGEGGREGYGRAVLWHLFHLEPEGGRP